MQVKISLATFLLAATCILCGCATITTNLILGATFNIWANSLSHGPVDDELTVSQAEPFESKHFFRSLYPYPAAPMSGYRAVSGNYYDDAGDNSFLLYVVPENGRKGHSSPSVTVFRIALLPLRPNELSIRPSLILFKKNNNEYRPSEISICDHDEYTFPIGDIISPWATIYGEKPPFFSWQREKGLPLATINGVEQSCLWVKFSSPPPSSKDSFLIALGDALIFKGSPTKDMSFRFNGAPEQGKLK